MKFLGLIGSILIATVLAQAAALLIVGFLQNEPVAIGALPMTVAFFALPAFFWSTVFILIVFFGMRFFGAIRYAPLGIGILAALFVAKSVIAPPNSWQEQNGGYDQAVAMNIIGALVLWAMYAQIRLWRS